MVNKPLRIGFGTPDFVTEKNFDSGIATYIYRTAKALIARGHEVHVVTKSDCDRSTFSYEGIQVHRVAFGKSWLELNRLTRYRLSTTMHLLGLSSQVYFRFKQLHRQQPFNLLQFPNCSSCGLFSMLMLRVPHVLRVSWYQPLWKRIETDEETLDTRFECLLERLQYRLSTHVYAPSVKLKEVLRTAQKVHDVDVLRNPMPPLNLEWDKSVSEHHLNNKKYFLFFGRFAWQKGFHVLAKAVPDVLRAHPDVYCVLIGRDRVASTERSMADVARAECKSFNDRLIILPPLSHKQLYPIISNSLLVVLPSLVDNSPNACLEAMALGKPVIGTNGASFEEIITDEVDGFLVPPNDSTALASKIKYALSHPRLRDIGSSAAATIADLSGDRALNMLLDYYDNVLHNNHQTRLSAQTHSSSLVAPNLEP